MAQRPETPTAQRISAAGFNELAVAGFRLSAGELIPAEDRNEKEEENCWELHLGRGRVQPKNSP